MRHCWCTPIQIVDVQVCCKHYLWDVKDLHVLQCLYNASHSTHSGDRLRRIFMAFMSWFPTSLLLKNHPGLEKDCPICIEYFSLQRIHPLKINEASLGGTQPVQPPQTYTMNLWPLVPLETTKTPNAVLTFQLFTLKEVKHTWK